MRARFYVPSIGRFASADTIVPGPTNPQAFNRYTYVLGNPLRLVDPSGHGHCDPEGNCQNPTPQPNTPAATSPIVPVTPLVTFSVVANCTSSIDEACEWSEDEMNTIQASALATGTKLAETLNAANGWNLSPSEAFLLVYGGSINFIKMGGELRGYWGETFLRAGNVHEIEVYADAGIAGEEHWAVHEFGHAFVNAVLGKARPVFMLKLFQMLVPGFPDRPTPNDENGTWGFAGPRFDWQNSESGEPPEEFADMFTGWVYNQWDAAGNLWSPTDAFRDNTWSPAGQMRSDFMNHFMPGWVQAATQ